MGRIIEAKAILSAEDRTGKAFDSVARKMKDIGKGMKASAEMDRLNKSLAEAKRSLQAIEQLRGLQTSFAAARTRFRTAQEDVSKLARELEKAKAAAAQFDGVKAFSKGWAIGKEIAEARKQVTTLDAALTKARKEVSGASSAFEGQATALKAAKREAEAYGISIRNLGEDEARLNRRVGITNDAIAKQARLDERHGLPAPRGAARMGATTTTEHGGARSRLAAGELGAAAALRYGANVAGVAGGGYLVADSFRKAYQSSMSFERSMIEVGKATDTSGAGLDAYGERILKLARETGKRKEDLASMLSAAGFAGRPKEELLSFTEYAAKATVAWGTSAEETGQAMAELGNIYEANQKRIEEIGDAVNAMADSSASKEVDLLEFLRRAGASGKQAGIAAEQMLAFGAAMKEVGVRNEVAGTAMEALLNVMKLGEEFSKSAKDGFKALGVESTKMRKEFVAKPVETMIGLLEKLDKVADPLKRAEIMTDMFGKEYQDDIAKLLNALPQLTKYLGAMGDKAAIAKAGVRFQFGQNIDKDVAKIDRATQAIDVLYKRIGDPIKAQAGGIADEINNMVAKLEEGDSILQRLMARVTGVDPGSAPKPLELPKVDGENTAEEWFEKNLPWLSGKRWNEGVDDALGKTGKEAAARARGDTSEDRAAARERIIQRPAEIEDQIRRQGYIRDASKQTAREATGMRRSTAAQEAVRAEGEIARLRGELAKAWEAIGEIRLREKREAGAFGIDGVTGKTAETIGPGRFGFGVAGSPIRLPYNVPLPPSRPGGLPGDARQAPIEATITGPVELKLPPDWQPRGVPQVPGMGIGGGRAVQMPEERLDQSVRGPITAEVRSMPPVTGTVSGTLDLNQTVSVQPSPLFTATFDGFGRRLAKVEGRISSIGSVIATNGPGSTGKSAPDAGKGARE